MPLGIVFSITFPDHLNLRICNMYNAKRCFQPCLTLHFGNNNLSNTMFFQTRRLDMFSQLILRFCSKTISLGTPLKIQWAPKWHPKSSRGAKEARFAEPCFYETVKYFLQQICFFILASWTYICLVLGPKNDSLSDPLQNPVDAKTSSKSDGCKHVEKQNTLYTYFMNPVFSTPE